ncbi:Pentatricopeptide repeat [Dillenia turbinata]|uniref:Pentatricopeptide repeat n=1 Tax=Dillenia turbinata TaxID=194707 RepID=A0AAN8UGV5_9MAGN
MEGTLFPNRPSLALPRTSKSTQLASSSSRFKFNPTIPLPPQTQSPSSFPLDTLLHHLLHLSSSSSSSPNRSQKPKPLRLVKSNHTHLSSFPENKTHFKKPNHSSITRYKIDADAVEAQFRHDSSVLDFLSDRSKLILSAILDMSNGGLSDFFDSIKDELFELDIVGLIKGLDLSGNWEKALILFEWVMKNSNLVEDRGNVEFIELMVRILGRESQHSVAVKLFDAIPVEEYCLDVRAYTTLLHAYARTTQGYVPGTVTYNALLQVFGKAGMYTEALSIFKEMESNKCPVDAVTYNELVAAYVRAGLYEEGAAVIKTMTSKGILPSAVTYTTIINAYGKAGKEDKALGLFNQMKELGCVPNVCTYNAVLGMLGKRSRSEEMIKILCGMRSSGCAPNRITWNTMLAVCGKKGLHKYVNRVFREMKSCGFEPDRQTFNTLIGAYGRCGSKIDALRMYEEMLKAGFTPCVTTYNALLNALAQRGDWKIAESVILDMRSKGFKPSETSYSLLINSYAKGGLGMLAEINEVISFMVENNCRPNELTYKIVIDAYCKARKYSEALDFVSNISEVDDRIEDDSIQRLSSRVRMCVRRKERWLASPLTGTGVAFELTCFLRCNLDVAFRNLSASSAVFRDFKGFCSSAVVGEAMGSIAGYFGIPGGVGVERPGSFGRLICVMYLVRLMPNMV